MAVRDSLHNESDERRALRESVGKLVGRYGRAYFQDVTRRGARPDALWAELGQAGFLGVHLPEEYGGGGGGLADLAIVIEETATPGLPAVHARISPAIAGSILAAHGSADQKQRWLPGHRRRHEEGGASRSPSRTPASNTHNITTTAHPRRRRLATAAGRSTRSPASTRPTPCSSSPATGAEPERAASRAVAVPRADRRARARPSDRSTSALQIPENQFTVVLRRRAGAGRRRLSATEGTGLQAGLRRAEPRAGSRPPRIGVGIGRYALERAARLRQRSAACGRRRSAPTRASPTRSPSA